MPFYRHSAAGAGQILYVRDQRILEDYGKTRVTDADYGNGILQAIAFGNASGQDGDAIMCGPMRAALMDATVTRPGLRLFGSSTEIIRSANTYAHLLKLTGDEIEMGGIFLNGQGIANTGLGFGLHVTGNRCILRDYESSGNRGTTATDGHGTNTRIDGDDCLIRNYVSRDAGYAALSMHDSNRLVVDGADLYNQNHRALAISGVTRSEWIELKNIRSVATEPDKYAYLNQHYSVGGSLGELRMTNVVLEEGDKYGDGISFDDIVGHNMCKFENTDKLIIDNSQFLHGINQNADINAVVRSLYFQDDGTNFPVQEVIITKSTIADTITMNHKSDYFFAEDTYFGRYHLADYGELFYRLYSKYSEFRRCTFNIWNRAKVFAIYDTIFNPSAASDVYVFRSRNRFIGNSASAQHVFRHNNGTDNGTLSINAGRVIFDKSNTMENAGLGEFYRSDNEVETLVCTTDANGTMQWDEDKVGTGVDKHPAPGAGPNYFAGMAANDDGDRIKHVKWYAAGTQTTIEKEWVAHAGVWKEA